MVIDDGRPGPHEAAAPHAEYGGVAALDDVAAAAQGALPRRWLALVALAVAVVRFGFGSERRIYDLLPDEAGTVAMSRFLAGRPGFDMFDSSTWQPGLALLHAPVSSVVDDPSAAYQLGLLLLAVVAGAAAALLALVVHRLTALGAARSAVTAVVLALTPGGVSSTMFFWSEALVWLAFLAALVAVLRYMERRTTGSAIAAVALTVPGYAVHGRLLALVGVVVILIVADSIRLRRHVLAAAVSLASVASVGVIGAASRWIFDRVWDTPDSENTASTALANLADPLAVVDAFAGQLWYLLVSSVGLFGVGAVVLAQRSLRGGPEARDARVVLLMVGTMMGASALFLAGRTVSSFPIYGRYNDAVSASVVAVGAAWLLRSGRLVRGVAGLAPLLASLVATALLGLVVAARHGDTIAERVTAPMVAGVVAYRADTVGIDVMQVSAVAVALAVAIGGAAAIPHRLREGLVLVVVAALLTIGVARLRTASNPLLNSATRASTVVSVEDLVAPNEPLGVMFVPADTTPPPTVTPFAQRRRAFVYQFYLVGREFEEVDGPVPGDDIRYVFAPMDDPTMVAAGASPVWQDPVILMALWAEPGATGGAP